LSEGKSSKCPSGNFCLKALEEIRHGLPNKRLSGTSFNFLIWKSESNQTHVSGQTLREIAQSQQMSLSKLLAAIKAERRQNSLSSAIRVFVLNHYRVHESLRSTPAMARGIADRVWTISDLLHAPLATQPITPVTTAPDGRKRFTVIDGGVS
jgi:hypothetical protein